MQPQSHVRVWAMTGPREKATYICELDDSKSSKISETIVGSVFIDNQGDILHRFRTEPARHGGGGCCFAFVLQ